METNTNQLIRGILERFDLERKTTLIKCFMHNRAGLRSWLISNMNELVLDAMFSSPDESVAMFVSAEEYPALADKIIEEWKEV